MGHRLETGETFDEKIQSVLVQVKCVIVVWSKESVKSQWVRAEKSIGRERGILVPVMIRPETIPVPFNLLHTADLISRNGDRGHPGYRQVVKQVKQLAGKSHVKPPPNRVMRCGWQAALTFAIVGALGVAQVTFRLRDLLRPVDPVVEARREHTGSLAKRAAFGVRPGEFDKFSGRRIARQIFKPDTRDQLNAEAAKGDPSVLTLKCAVESWATPDGIRDWEGARPACDKAAGAGEPDVHACLGQLRIATAVYAPSDEERAGMETSATGEFRKAADMGVGWGEIEYGWRLRSGEGVAADSAAAETLFNSAQAKGTPAADQALGRLYFSNEVASAMNPDEAFALVREAAEAGDAGAQFFVAEKLVEGWNFTTDYEAALAYYKTAADEGDVSWRAARFIEDTERRIADAKTAEPAPVAPAAN